MVAIPTKASDTAMAGYVANIVECFTSATPEQRIAGRTWYPTGHRIAVDVGHGDARTGAGIIAALSPQLAWHVNVRLALDARNGYVHGHTRRNLDKVRQIMAGADPSDVLPMSVKTGSFFVNLYDPANPDAVTIDRWAYRTAVGITSRKHPDFDGEYRLGNATRYATLATAYRLAARLLGEVASTVQATCWVVLRDDIGRHHFKEGDPS